MEAFRETGALLFFSRRAHLLTTSSSQSPFSSVSALRQKLRTLPCSSSPHKAGFAGAPSAVVFPSETVRSARRMRLHLRPKCRRKRRLTSETLACGLVCGSLMDNVTSRWAAVIVHAVGKELPIWKLLIWAGNSPTHAAACLRKSATGSFVAVMGASCFVTHPFSFLRKRNKKKGR